MHEDIEYSGHSNLELVSQSHRFNDWMYREVSAGLKGDILEIGSGIGTHSEKIIRDRLPNSHIMLTDISSTYVKGLEDRFSTNNVNVSVSKLDLNRREDYEKIGYERFDSILALNVLEHIEDDEFALHQLYKMLRNEGTVVILVPCHKFLYNVIDKNVGHFRRYTRKELESKVNKTQFMIQRIFYFNMLGIVGWYMNGSLAKNPQISNSASRIYDSLIPIARHLEMLMGRRIGLSIICFLKKEPKK